MTPSNLEDHPTGTINLNAIIRGNWIALNDTLDPAHAAAQRGLIEAAAIGQATLTTITYGASVSASMLAKPISLLAITGNVAIAVTNKAAGRSRTLIITCDGTDRTITWPIGAVWSGPPATTILAGTALAIQIHSTTGADSGLVLSLGGTAYTAGSGISLTAGAFAADATIARLSSPAFTDIPTAPTATLSTNTTQLATTAFVMAQIGAGGYVTLTGTETLTNKTLDEPVITGQILGALGPAVLEIAEVASSVNVVSITNAATGTAPIIQPAGSDTNTDLTIQAKGTGAVVIPRGKITAETFKLAASAYVEVTGSRAVTDADNGKILYSTSASDYTLTYPDSLTKPFSHTLKQEGTGELIVAVSGTATLRNSDSHTRTGGQWAAASIDYRTGNDVVFFGRTAA